MADTGRRRLTLGASCGSALGRWYVRWGTGGGALGRPRPILRDSLHRLVPRQRLERYRAPRLRQTLEVHAGCCCLSVAGSSPLRAQRTDDVPEDGTEDHGRQHCGEQGAEQPVVVVVLPVVGHVAVHQAAGRAGAGPHQDAPVLVAPEPGQASLHRHLWSAKKKKKQDIPVRTAFAAGCNGAYRGMNFPKFVRFSSHSPSPLPA
uniref:Uncharacterized protein n=1 Tax=Anopheles coluzzii TaxID=1518534 RepID=A0A8W7PUT5_ANOCL